MSNSYARYSGAGSGGGSGGVSSLNGETGAITLTGSNGITVTTPSSNVINLAGSGGTVTSVGLADASITPIYSISGSPVTGSGTLTLTLSTQTANTVFSGPTSGGASQPTFRSLVSADIPSLTGLYANRALSNLSSTAVNTDINSASSGTINLGAFNNAWASVNSLNFTVSNGSVGQALFTQDTLTPSGRNIVASIQSLGSGPNALALYTPTNNTSGSVYIETGNGAAGNSGNIILTTGTATSTRGQITFVDGSQGTAGQIWTSTNTTGAGHWAAAPATGANIALSNLSATAINVQFLQFDPSAFGTYFIQTPNAVGSTASKALTLASGNVVNSSAGALSVIAGTATGTTGNGGNLSLNAGLAVNGTAGSSALTGGDSTGSGPAGAVSIAGGDSNAGASGNVNIIGGSSSSSGAGGSILLQAGTSSSGSQGTLTFSTDGNFSIGAINGPNAPQLQLFNGSNAFYSGLQASNSLAANTVWTLPLVDGSSGQFLKTNGSGQLSFATPASGSVTSVGLSLPGIFTVTGSPVTSSGTLTATLVSQAANTFFAAPNGSSGVPTFRLIVPADVPTLNQNTTGTASNITATSNSTLTTLSSLSLPVSQLTGTTLPSSIVNSSLASLGAQSQALNLNSHQINNVTDPISAQDAATKNYVDNAVQGLNPAVAVQAATTAASDTSSFTYNNGVSGIGATFTGAVNTPVIIDGFPFSALGQRLLVKNDTQSPSGAFNGIYYVTQVQTALLAPILTRALDYDQPSDINNTGAIPVINGMVNGTTQWVETALVNTVGTDPLTFTKFARNPADYLLKANNLSDVSSPSTSFNNISPATTTGDIISYSGGSNVRVGAGTAGYVWTSNGPGVLPSYQPAPGTVSAFFASSQVTTISSLYTGTSFSTFSNSPAFTFTPTITGTYKVYSSIGLNENTTNTFGIVRIFNTSGGATLLYESQGDSFAGTAANEENVFIQSVYTLTAGTSYVFDIQGKNGSTGSLALDGSSAPFYMFAELEVTGSSSSAVIATYHCSSNNSTSPTTPINFDAMDIDTNSAVTTGTWKFTAPFTGYYDVSVMILTLSSNSTYFYQLYKNGTLFNGVLAESLNGDNQYASGTYVIQLNAGDFIDVRSNLTVTVQGGALNSTNTNWISIKKVN